MTAELVSNSPRVKERNKAAKEPGRAEATGTEGPAVLREALAPCVPSEVPRAGVE